jgi:signal transduction histidine kinase
VSALTPARLRVGLALFFAALAIPAAVLVLTAHDRLKWEAFHHYRGLAEELAARIDARAAQLVRNEEARSFADYGFLVVAGEASANFVQRSALSAFPVDGTLPGLIGHFQVDAQGRLDTPLLPDAGVDAARYGVPAAEREQRAARVARIREILGANRLVHARGDPATAARADARPAAAPAASAEDAVRDPPTAPALGGRARMPSFTEESKTSALDEDLRQHSAPSAARDAGSRRAPPAQSAFDELERATTQQRAPSPARGAGLGRVEELQLEAPFARRDAPAPSAATAAAPDPAPRAARKERGAVPASEADLAADRAAPIRTFESELDPFQAALLDSGELVLFRKVWRDGQRFIQGALIDRARFVEALIESAFRGSAVAQMSNLGVAWRGEVVAGYGAASASRYLHSTQELDGALLYRTRLSAPLADMDLVFTVTRLPEGPGAQVITWVAVVLALVLCAGTALLYRLGARQIALARQQRDFISAVSHELRTPLTSIRMYAQMLREGWASEDKKPGYYAYIHDESERLSRLIANVLQFARMSRDEVEVNLHSVRAGELIDLARSKVASQVESAGFTLHIECAAPAAAAQLQADPDAFIQVIINLVDNAVKFSARAERKVVELSCRVDESERVVFAVRDHGPGVARHQRRRIFALFYRAGSELTRDTTGTGIGLALVRRLCEAMGAQVDVTDADPGARFSVYFPRAG